MNSSDFRHLALRNFDLIKYVLYSEDEIFVMDMVKKVACEISDKYQFEDLRTLVRHKDKPQLYRCLFFFLLNFHKEFRYWVLQNDKALGLTPVCPYKATSFLKALKYEILPPFLVDERMTLQELDRKIKVAYIAA